MRTDSRRRPRVAREQAAQYRAALETLRSAVVHTNIDAIFAESA